MKRFFEDNSLSLAFWALFLASGIGQLLSGTALQLEHPAASSGGQTLLSFAGTSEFWFGVFSNWQAALLQLLVLVILTVFLRQRGASHSRKPKGEGGQAGEGHRRSFFGATESWAYRNSLSLALLGVFAVSFAGFLWSGFLDYDAARRRLGEDDMDFAHYLVSAKLWFSVFQTWQAEFFAMASFLLMSVFLRQEDSAESKPVSADDDETGEVNH
jgi:hypothetical protein